MNTARTHTNTNAKNKHICWCEGVRSRRARRPRRTRSARKRARLCARAGVVCIVTEQFRQRLCDVAVHKIDTHIRSAPHMAKIADRCCDAGGMSMLPRPTPARWYKKVRGHIWRPTRSVAMSCSRAPPRPHAALRSTPPRAEGDQSPMYVPMHLQMRLPNSSPQSPRPMPRLQASSLKPFDCWGFVTNASLPSSPNASDVSALPGSSTPPRPRRRTRCIQGARHCRPRQRSRQG